MRALDSPERHYLWTAGTVLAAAAVGTAGTDTSSAWYRTLSKPAWQPPAAAFPIAWTALYATLIAAGGRVLQGTRVPAQRATYQRAYLTNLALNAGWTWTFFRSHRPELALLEVLALQASTADLARRSWQADRRAGATLLPYVGWCTLATALTASIWRRNR